jgi:DNA-binding LytR/AlgR family response regulator
MVPHGRFCAIRVISFMRPRLHVIYITGFAEAAEKAQRGSVLKKPIRAADLRQIVRKEMAGYA